MIENSFSARLRKVIAELGLSKAEFARSLGVTRNYIYCLTGGRRQSCSRSLAMLIEQKYGCSAAWLLRGEEYGENGKEEVISRIRRLNPETLRAVAEYLDKLKGENGA